MTLERIFIFIKLQEEDLEV